MPDAVPFVNTPSTLRSPLFYAEVSATQANTGQAQKRTLIIGQKTLAGQAQVGQPVVAVAADGSFQGGPGSQLDLMIRKYRANDPFGPLWILPLGDDGGATAATGAFVVTGTSTAAGAISAYVAGQLVTVPIASGTTAAAAATALYNAINALTTLPVTATNGVAGTASLTAKNGGLVGNDIEIAVNLGGYVGGEATPAGLTVTPSGQVLSGGATNPSLTVGLGNLQDEPFDFIVSPYTDSASLTAIATFLGDVTGRWSWESQTYGHHFTAYRQTYGGLVTFGATVNDPHLTVLGLPGNSVPHTAMEWAAALAAQVASSARVDPAQPLQTLQLLGLKPPPLGGRFTLAQREALLYAGISTFVVAQGGAIAISRAITTYQTNAFGQPDNSYLAVETMHTLTEVLRRLREAVTSEYPRAKLAADGTRFAPGSNIVTPATIKAFLIGQYRELEFGGLVQGSDVFAANLVVVQNPTNPNRVDVLWPVILIGQLNVFALLAQFRLAVPAAPAAAASSAALV